MSCLLFKHCLVATVCSTLMLPFSHVVILYILVSRNSQGVPFSLVVQAMCVLSMSPQIRHDQYNMSELPKTVFKSNLQSATVGGGGGGAAAGLLVWLRGGAAAGLLVRLRGGAAAGLLVWLRIRKLYAVMYV